MRVLFADKLPDRARVRLASHGFEVRVEADATGAALTALMHAYDPAVLVVRSTRVDRATLAAGSALSLVVRAGAGVNTIDLEAAGEYGVFVANCPGKNADAVAELALGLMLAIDRRIPDNVIDLRAGIWNKGLYGKALGLKGRTLGILGLGQIGGEVARRARAFGMRVVGWSRSLDEARAGSLGVERAETPEALAAQSDILSIHLALSGQTRGFVGDAILGALRPDSVVINTSRAEVVDHEALARHLDARQLWLGTDVFADEPSGSKGSITDALAGHPRVIGTHHIGASTEQAQQAVADEVCRIIELYRTSGRAPNCVNLAIESRATHCVVVRHRDEVGVLASVLEALKAGGINVAEMENMLFSAGGAASARILVHQAPDPDVITAMRAAPNVLHVNVVPLNPRRS